MVGNGFSADLTQLMLQGLTTNHYPIIEFGNAKGIGASDKGFPAPLSDEEYLKLAQPFLNKDEIGMFLNAKRYEAANLELAASYNLGFFRCGSNAGDAHQPDFRLAVWMLTGILNKIPFVSLSHEPITLPWPAW